MEINFGDKIDRDSVMEWMWKVRARGDSGISSRFLTSTAGWTMTLLAEMGKTVSERRVTGEKSRDVIWTFRIWYNQNESVNLMADSDLHSRGFDSWEQTEICQPREFFTASISSSSIYITSVSILPVPQWPIYITQCALSYFFSVFG